MGVAERIVIRFEPTVAAHVAAASQLANSFRALRAPQIGPGECAAVVLFDQPDKFDMIPKRHRDRGVLNGEKHIEGRRRDHKYQQALPGPLAQ